MSDKEIERLDFILNRLIQFGGNVDSNTLHQYGLYDEYNNNGEKITSDFKKLQSEFYKVGASEIILSQDDYLICACDKTTDFKKEYGGFKNYYLIREEKDKKDLLKEKNNELIERRKNAMVNHNYWYTRPKNIIGGILIVLTFIGLGTYKDIKEHLSSNIESEEARLQEHKKEEGNIKDSLETKNKREYNNATELKSDEPK